MDSQSFQDIMEGTHRHFGWKDLHRRPYCVEAGQPMRAAAIVYCILMHSGARVKYRVLSALSKRVSPGGKIELLCNDLGQVCSRILYGVEF